MIAISLPSFAVMTTFESKSVVCIVSPRKISSPTFNTLCVPSFAVAITLDPCEMLFITPILVAILLPYLKNFERILIY